MIVGADDRCGTSDDGGTKDLAWMSQGSGHCSTCDGDSAHRVTTSFRSMGRSSLRCTPRVEREDGSWLIDGSMDIAELKKWFLFASFPGEEDGDFETLGGFVLDRFGHIPSVGESFTWN